MKPKKTTTKKPADDFGLVVENAFDFLRKALVEFDKKPKYSVIHFHAAVELLLKARLLWEHWTLIIAKPEDADLDKFRSGDFQSVSIRQAKVRLEKTVQDGLTEKESACFLRLTDHRNRMVHFYHASQTGNNVELEKIVVEQCLAWYYLCGLFGRWERQFSEYKKQIERIDKAMHRHRKFLKTKFDAQKGEIEKLTKKGVTFHGCPTCGFESFQEDSDCEPILEFKCLVCGFRDSGLVVECPDCGGEKRLIGEPWQKCDGCGYDIEPEDVQRFLTKDFVWDKHDPDRSIVAHCEACDGYETVVEVGDRWICSQCFILYDAEDIGTCGWCSSLSTGNLEDSYLTGCVACDGKCGWDSDKED